MLVSNMYASNIYVELFGIFSQHNATISGDISSNKSKRLSTIVREQASEKLNSFHVRGKFRVATVCLHYAPYFFMLISMVYVYHLPACTFWHNSMTK